MINGAIVLTVKIGTGVAQVLCQRVAAERATLFPNLPVVGKFSLADPVCTHLAPGRYDCLSDMFVGDHHVQ